MAKTAQLPSKLRHDPAVPDLLLTNTKTVPTAKSATAAKRDTLRREDNHTIHKHVADQKAIVGALRVLERDARLGMMSCACSCGFVDVLLFLIHTFA